jgi:hypothetical protein
MLYPYSPFSAQLQTTLPRAGQSWRTQHPNPISIHTSQSGWLAIIHHDHSADLTFTPAA